MNEWKRLDIRSCMVQVGVETAATGKLTYAEEAKES